MLPWADQPLRVLSSRQGKGTGRCPRGKSRAGLICPQPPAALTQGSPSTPVNSVSPPPHTCTAQQGSQACLAPGRGGRAEYSLRLPSPPQPLPVLSLGPDLLISRGEGPPVLHTSGVNLGYKRCFKPSLPPPAPGARAERPDTGRSPTQGTSGSYFHWFGVPATLNERVCLKRQQKAAGAGPQPPASGESQTLYLVTPAPLFELSPALLDGVAARAPSRGQSPSLASHPLFPPSLGGGTVVWHSEGSRRQLTRPREGKDQATATGTPRPWRPGPHPWFLLIAKSKPKSQSQSSRPHDHMRPPGHVLTWTRTPN